jgi:anti-sigma B factor antagonist
MILYDSLAEIKNRFENIMKKIQDNVDVIIDLTKISFIDSSGLGFLVNMCKQMRKSGKQILISGLRENVMQLFRLTGVAKYFDIFDNKQAAKEFLEEKK